MMLLTGCGDGSDTGDGVTSSNIQDGPGAANQAAQQDESPCLDTTPIATMSTQDRASLDTYVQSHGDVLTTDANGADSICTLQKNPQTGEVEQHYISREDKFSDYLLYSALLGQGQTLATYGLISGDLDPLEALALSSYSSVRRDGGFYTPYRHYNDGTWLRQVPTTTTVHITKVQYGNQTPMKYDDAQKKPTPPAYRTARTIRTTKVNPDQKAVITPPKPGSKSSVIAVQKRVPPPAAYPNTSRSTTITKTSTKPKVTTKKNTAPKSKPR
jgi:hypothetical protein